MKNLKFTLVAILSAIAFDAMAWSAVMNKAIVMLAEENLSRKAKSEVAALLNAPLHEVKFGEKIALAHLNSEARSVTDKAGDAVVELEKSIAVLSDKTQSMEARKSALQSVVELTVNLHTPSCVRIEGKLDEDFTFIQHNGRMAVSRWYKESNLGWSAMWNKEFHRRHKAFSAEMWLYDMRISSQKIAKSLLKGEVAPRKWAEQNAKRVLEVLPTFRAKGAIDNLEVTKVEPINDISMSEAAYHLALILNKSLK